MHAAHARTRAILRGCLPSALVATLVAAPVATFGIDAALELKLERTISLAGPEFGRPVAIAAGPFGRLFLADVARGTVVRLDSDGHVLFAFETPSGQPGLQPLDIEVTGFKVYVLDAQSSALLRYTDQGSYLDVLRSFRDDISDTPRALSVDATGRVLLSLGPLHQVRLLDESHRVESIIGGFGSRPGEMSRPTGVAFATGGAFYVADTGNVRIERFAGVGNFESAFSDSLGEPRGLAVGPAGEVLVADPRRASVHLFGPTGGHRAELRLPDYQPLDVTIVGDTLWVLSASPPALLRARVLRGG